MNSNNNYVQEPVDLMFYHRLYTSSNIYQALSSEQLRIYLYYLRHDHRCMHNFSDVSTCEMIPDSSPSQGLSHVDYMTSKRQKLELQRALLSADSVCDAITQMRASCTMCDLARICRIPGPDFSSLQPYSALFFWRLFRRLYYCKYKTYIQKCTWRAAADIFQRFKRHPTAGEDLVFCMWQAFHPKCELKSPWYTPLERSMSYTGDFIVDYASLETREFFHRNVERMHVQPVTVVRNVMVHFPVIKKQMLPLNEAHMFSLAGAAARDIVDSSITRNAQKVDRVIDNLDNLGDRLHETTSKFNVAIDEISDGTRKLLKLWEDQSQKVYQRFFAAEGKIEIALDASTSGLTKMYESIGRKSMMLCEVFALYVTKRYLNDIVWYFLLAICVVRWLGLEDIIPKVAHVVHGLISKYFRYEASENHETLNEAHSASSGGVMVVAGTVLAAIGGVLFNKLPRGTAVERFLKTIDTSFTINRSLDNIPKLFEKIADFVQKAIDWWSKDDIKDWDLRQQYVEYKDAYASWCALVSEANTVENKLRMEYDEEYRDFVLKLRDEANVYMQMFNDKRWPAYFRSTFNQSYRTICELSTVCETARRSRQFRYDPFCIWISGGVRAGKSFLCTEICKDIARMLNAPLENSVYARGASDHWDRYVGQAVVYFDDFGQWKGDMGQERMSEFIACRSNNMWITKQADLADKGRPFTSKAMVVSSNFDYCDTAAVHLAEAVHSRRHMVWHVVIPAKYMDAEQNLPNWKMIADASQEDIAEHGEMRFRHMMFQRVPALPGTARKGPLISYLTFREEVRKEFQEYHEYQTKLVRQYYTDITKRCFEQKEKVEQAVEEMDENLNEAHGALEKDGHYYVDLKEWPENLQSFIRTFREWTGEGPHWYALGEKEYQILRHFEIDNTSQTHGVGYIDGHFASINESTWDFHETMRYHLNRTQMVELYGRWKDMWTEELRMREGGSVNPLPRIDEMQSRWKMWADKIPDWKQKSSSILSSITGSKILKTLLAAGALVGAAALGWKLMNWSKSEDDEEEYDEPFQTGVDVFLEGMKSEIPRKDYNRWKPVFEANAKKAFKVYREEVHNEAEMTVSGDPRTSRPIRTHTVAARHPPTRVTKLNDAHSSSDPNTMDIINNSFKMHLWRVSRENGFRTQGLAFDGHNLLIPFHLIADARNGELMILDNGEVIPITFALDKTKVLRVGKEDLAVIRDVARMPPGPRLSKLFVREKDIAKYCGELEGGLLVNDGKLGFTFYSAKFQDITTVPVQDSHCAPTSTEVYKVTSGWYHNAPLTKGMCMAPLFVFNPKLERKVVGVHISGVKKGTSGGTAILVTEEMLKEYAGFTAFDNDLNEGHLKDLVVEEFYSPMVGPGYTTYGKCPKSWHEFAPETTTIKKSLIHGLVREPTSGPAILSRFDPRNTERISPMKNALQKYEKRTLPFNPEDRKQVRAQMHAMHIGAVKPLVSDVGTIDYELIVNGSPTESFYKALELDSSPGIPWKRNRPPGVSGKRHLFVQREDFTHYMKPELAKEVTQALKDLKNGIRPPTLWVHVPKDERRPLAKLRAVKTRIFTMAPVDFTLACRALTMHFTAAFYKAHATTYSSIGVDAHSPVWTEMMTKLLRVGARGGDGDYGQYDGTLDPDLIDDALELIADWTLHYCGNTYKVQTNTEDIIFSAFEYKRALKILATEFVHTAQLVLNILHRKTQGNPSGNPLTVVLNTIVGMSYLMLAFMELSRRNNRLDLTTRDFNRLVAALIYGDDNIYSIDESIIDWYNPMTLSEFFAEHGIEYTTADKSGAAQSVKDVKDLRFLKRGWRPDEIYPKVLHAPIDTDTIYEMLNWIRECPNEREQMYVQIDTALREARAHGVKFFDSFREEINSALAKVDLPPVGNDYGRFQEEFLSQFF